LDTLDNVLRSFHAFKSNPSYQTFEQIKQHIQNKQDDVAVRNVMTDFCGNIIRNEKYKSFHSLFENFELSAE
jgi:hypothetical protein